MGYTVDIDTGGTFTDGFFTNGPHIEMVKVDTTPDNLTICFEECVRAGAERFGIPLSDFLGATDTIRFSTTIGTNALIQHTGARVGLIATSSSLDRVLEEEGLFEIVSRDCIVGVTEETSPDGKVITPVSEAEISAALETLLDLGVRSVVIALANAWANPVNERAIRTIVQRLQPRHYLGSPRVLVSTDLAGRPDDVTVRVITSALNAYVHPELARHLYKAEDFLRTNGYRKPLLIVHSGGGVARVAKTTALHTYNSGPVAALYGARSISQSLGIDHVVTLDIGGTSADIGLLHGDTLSIENEPSVGRLRVNMPMITVDPIGAGGGSIASVDGTGALRVGPKSAGAAPGPACYDLGGDQPTVTDASVVLGLIDPEFFLGGRRVLKRDLSLRVIEQSVAKPLGLGVEEAAAAVKSKLEEQIADRIAALLPSDTDRSGMVLYAYGGGGSLHSADIAKRLGLKRVMTFPASPVFSAMGSSTMNIAHEYVRYVPGDRSGVDKSVLADALRELGVRATRDLEDEGLDAALADHRMTIVPYKEAGHDDNGTDAVSAAIRDTDADVAALVSDVLGSISGNDWEGLLLSVVSSYPVPQWKLKEQYNDGEVAQAFKGVRPIFLEGRVQEVPVYDMERIPTRKTFDGPAVIESEHTTCLVPVGSRYEVNEMGFGVIEVEQ